MIPAGRCRYEEKTGDMLALENRKHVGERIEKTIIAGHQNGARKKGLGVINRGPKFFRVDDAIVSLQELELLAKDLGFYQVPVEKFVTAGIIDRQDAMVVHDRVARARSDAGQTSRVMQRWINRVLEEWTDEPHRSGTEGIVASDESRLDNGSNGPAETLQRHFNWTVR